MDPTALAVGTDILPGHDSPAATGIVTLELRHEYWPKTSLLLTCPVQVMFGITRPALTAHPVTSLIRSTIGSNVRVATVLLMRSETLPALPPARSAMMRSTSRASPN